MKRNPNHSHLGKATTALATVASAVIILAGCGQPDNRAEVTCDSGSADANFNDGEYAILTTQGRGEPSPSFTVWKNRRQGHTEYDVVVSIRSRGPVQWTESTTDEYGESNPDYTMEYEGETWSIDIAQDGSSVKIEGSCP